MSPAKYSVELGVGAEFHFVNPDGTSLSREPIYMSGEEAAKILSTFDWETSFDAQPTFVIREELEKLEEVVSVVVQSPDLLMKALLMAGALYVNNQNLHRKMFYDGSKKWWVVIEQKPGQRSPKVLLRTTNLDDATIFLLGEEQDE